MPADLCNVIRGRPVPSCRRAVTASSVSPSVTTHSNTSAWASITVYPPTVAAMPSRGSADSSCSSCGGWHMRQLPIKRCAHSELAGKTPSLLWWLCEKTSRLQPINRPMHVVRRRRAHDASKVPLLPRFLDTVHVILADLLTYGLSYMLPNHDTSAQRRRGTAQHGADGWLGRGSHRLTTVNPAPCTRSASTRWMLPFGHPARGGLLLPMGFNPANWTRSTASVPTAS